MRRFWCCIDFFIFLMGDTYSASGRLCFSGVGVTRSVAGDSMRDEDGAGSGTTVTSVGVAGAVADVVVVGISCLDDLMDGMGDWCLGGAAQIEVWPVLLLNLCISTKSRVISLLPRRT
ncbi:hypothetical protein GN958_ATG18825 [Phytophthora infestans]|uniref:Secreted protein n=1 Tax=Phytophthora infestans TaxID=4787 RepID=A0A8S9TWP1_PHYIN|nr:hypothetical protein GN958_ATG18825 [Phytophthora infestans]